MRHNIKKALCSVKNVKLSTILKELLDEKNLDYKTFASKIGISASRVTDYIRNDKLPSIDNLIKIADYFDCSTDFLLGRTNDETNAKFSAPIPFSERIVYLKDYFNVSNKDIYTKNGITKSRYFNWLSGKRQPSIDNIISLAEILELR